MSRTTPGAMRPTLAIRYAEEQAAHMVERLRLGCWLAITLIPVFVTLDLILHPHMLLPFAAIRLTMMVLATLTLFVLRRPWGRRHIDVLSFLTLSQLGLGIVLMITLVGGGSSPYYAGVNLVMLGAAVLMPWEIGPSAAFVGLMVGLMALGEWLLP